MVFKYCLLILIATIWCVAAKSSEGEGCIFRTSGEFGVCTPFKDCSYAEGQACRGTPPQRCSSYADDGSVCCRSQECPPLPPGLVHAPVTGYKTWDYCTGIASLAFPCEFLGDSFSRTDACPQLPDRNATMGVVQAGEYPHLVLLTTIANEADITWNNAYAGTLISDKWVLTSALILTGRTYAKVGGIPEGGTVYKVEREIRHPDYDSPILYNDIGLVELEKSVIFSNLVLPACLHTGSVLPEEKLKDIVAKTRIFYSMDVNIASHEDCSEVYNDYEVLVPNGVDKDIQFCIRPTGGVDQGSLYGAPLQVYNGASVACTQTVLGVFSNSADEMHIITRVAAYIPWIESIVWP